MCQKEDQMIDIKTTENACHVSDRATDWKWDLEEHENKKKKRKKRKKKEEEMCTSLFHKAKISAEL